MSISLSCFAQTSMQGGSMRGGSMNDARGLPIDNNAYGWWRADRGVVLNGTNVQSWTDLTANNWAISQYVTTNQPWFIPSYTTNNLPAVYFESGANRHLKCDAVAPAFSGEDKAFSIIALVVGQTNGNSCMPISFGWGSASNANGSKKGISLNRPGSSIVSGTFLCADTNSAAIAGVVYVQSFTGNVTNRATIYATTYDGQNGMLYNNLVAGTNNFFDTGKITVNQFTLGLARGTNGVAAAGTQGSIWRGSFSEIQIYTNALTGTQITNLVNDINSRNKVY